MTDRDAAEILRWALPRLGLRWRGFEHVRRQVRKRMGRRARELGLDASEYRALLERDEAELGVLDSFCRISISRFWRDAPVFDALRAEVLPALARAVIARGERTLRVWSAGCASGEEPYSIAIALVLDVLPGMRGAVDATILATDADQALLARAVRGCYPPATLRELPPELRARAFDEVGAERCVRAEVRQPVRFAHGDLRAGLPDGPFDLVLCRNATFTYFDEGNQERFFGAIRERLVPAGALVLGKRERLPDGVSAEPLVVGLPIFAASAP